MRLMVRRQLMGYKMNMFRIAELVSNSTSIWQVVNLYYGEDFDHNDADTWIFYQKVNYYKKKYGMVLGEKLVSTRPIILADKGVYHRELWIETVLNALQMLKHSDLENLDGIQLANSKGRKITGFMNMAACYKQRYPMDYIVVYIKTASLTKAVDHIAHEVGHSIWYTLMMPIEQHEWVILWNKYRRHMPTSYGMKNHVEGFAESFICYRLGYPLHEDITKVIATLETNWEVRL